MYNIAHLLYSITYQVDLKKARENRRRGQQFDGDKVILMIRRDDNESTDSLNPSKPSKPYHSLQDSMQAKRRKDGVDMLEKTFQKVRYIRNSTW